MNQEYHTTLTACGSIRLSVSSGIISVDEGNTISLFAFQDTGGNLLIQGNGLAWMSIEIIE